MAGEPPDSPEARIDANTPDSPFSGVGSVTVDGGVYSGTLIAARYVLTAAHVAPDDPARATFNVCIDGTQAVRIPVVRSVRHPAFRVVALDAVEFDIALLELAHEAPAAARRYVIWRGPVRAGMRIALAGFGASGAGSAPPSVGPRDTVRRTGANLIDWVKRAKDSPHAPLAYRFTFDPPPENRPERTRSLGNAIETGLAGGDSGCPALVGAPGALQLLGVNTLIARGKDSPGALSTYGTVGAGAVAAAHLDWIADIAEG